MTLLFGVAGAAIGRLYGGGWAGLQIGATIGSLLDANENKPDVGKLTDLKYSGSSYGTSIPRIWGATRVAGTVIWVSKDAHGNHLVQHSESSGGKKGGGSTNYSYSATFAVGFCEGTLYLPPTADSPNGTLVKRNVKLSKVYADDKLIWDASNPGANSINLTWHDGSENAASNADATIVAKEGAQTPSYAGLAYAVFVDLPLQDYSNRIPNISAELTTDSVGLQEIAQDYCGMVGAEVGVPITQSVRGIVANSRSAGKDMLQSLFSMCGCDLVEVDGALLAKHRGTSEVASLATRDLLPVASSKGQDGVIVTRKLKTELPSSLEVVYADSDRSFQQTTQSVVLQTAEVYNVASVQVMASMSAAEARAFAAQSLDQAWTERLSFEFSLPAKYLWLAPGDVVTVPYGSERFRVRLTEMQLAPLGEIRCKGVRDSTFDLVQGIGGSSGTGSPPPVVVVPGPLSGFAVGGAALTDDDRGQVYLTVGACGSNWQGASAYYSLDGTTYQFGARLSAQATFGTLSSSLEVVAAAGVVVGDACSVHLVNGSVTSMGGSPSGVNNPLWLGSANNMVIGTEVVQFEVATPSAGLGNFGISSLYRGLRGSTPAAHTVGETVFLLDGSLAKIKDSALVAGKSVWVKLLTPGQALADVTPISLVVGSPAQNVQDKKIVDLNSALIQHEAAVASSTTLGHIKVGSGLSIDSGGVLTATGSTLTLASVAYSGSTTDLTEGTNLFFTPVRALAAVLAGFSSAASRVAISATDSVLQALGKCQKYFDSLAAVAFSGSASDITTGTLPAAQVPALDASKVGSGTLGLARLPVIPANQTSGFAAVAISGSSSDVTEGSNLFFTTARSVGAVLVGFGVSTTRVAISASDSVLQAFGKCQKYFNDLASVAFSGSASDLTTGTLSSSRLPSSGVTAGSYTNANVTVDAQGRVTAASNGSAGGGSSAPSTTFIEGLNLEWVSATSIKVKSGAAYVLGAGAIVTVTSDTTITGLSTAANTWYYVYLKSDGSFEVSATGAAQYRGYAAQKSGDPSRRFIGSILANSAGTGICAFRRDPSSGLVRWREDIVSGGVWRVLGSGSATTLTSVSCGGVVPPTAQLFMCRYLNNGNVAAALRNSDDNVGSGIGIASVASNSGYTGLYSQQVDFVTLNSSQQLQYKMLSAVTSGNGLFIDAIGYTEPLK